MSKDITIPMQHIDGKGRKWRPYAVRFTGPDGAFEFHIHALSYDHAELLLEDIKATATVSTQVVEVVR